MRAIQGCAGRRPPVPQAGARRAPQPAPLSGRPHARASGSARRDRRSPRSWGPRCGRQAPSRSRRGPWRQVPVRRSKAAPGSTGTPPDRPAPPSRPRGPDSRTRSHIPRTAARGTCRAKSAGRSPRLSRRAPTARLRTRSTWPARGAGSASFPCPDGSPPASRAGTASGATTPPVSPGRAGSVAWICPEPVTRPPTAM